MKANRKSELLENYDSPMHVDRHIAVNLCDDAELASAANKLANSGGTQVKEYLFNALKNEKDEELRLILQRYKNGQSLSQTREELAAALNREISNSLAVNPVRFTSDRRNEISGRRDLEVGQSSGLRTFRANSEDVISVREKFPNLDRKIDEEYSKLSSMKFQKPVTKAEDIPTRAIQSAPEKMREKLKNVDPKTQQAMVQVCNQMNDPKAFAEYTRALKKDTAVEMMKSGTTRDIAALNRGEVNRTAVMRVLVQRHRAQGNDQFSTIAGRPIVGGKPQEFWDFLGSKRGINYWVPLFDNFGDKTLARPEDLSHILSPVLGISD